MALSIETAFRSAMAAAVTWVSPLARYLICSREILAKTNQPEASIWVRVCGSGPYSCATAGVLKGAMRLHAQKLHGTD
jgi:hypothetical protein